MEDEYNSKEQQWIETSVWEWNDKNNNMGSAMRRQRLSELWYICAIYLEQSDHTYLSRHYTWKTKGQLNRLKG